MRIFNSISNLFYFSKNKNLDYGKRKQKYCLNTPMYYNVKRRLLLARSQVCFGYELYAGEDFKKGEFVGEYFGEILDN